MLDAMRIGVQECGSIYGSSCIPALQLRSRARGLHPSARPNHDSIDGAAPPRRALHQRSRPRELHALGIPPRGARNHDFDPRRRTTTTRSPPALALARGARARDPPRAKRATTTRGTGLGTRLASSRNRMVRGMEHEAVERAFDRLRPILWAHAVPLEWGWLAPLAAPILISAMMVGGLRLRNI
jgi:hypothetical protein